MAAEFWLLLTFFLQETGRPRFALQPLYIPPASLAKASPSCSHFPLLLRLYTGMETNSPKPGG